MNAVFETYFSRFEAFPLKIHKPLPSRLGLIVIIPCYDEPEIEITISSLLECTSPSCAVEIIVAVNHSMASPIEIKERNRKTYNRLLELSLQISSKSLILTPLYAPDLPEKTAGVGLARKIAMDEAVQHFALIDNPEGIIVSCDADVLVDKNYFVEIEKFYLNHEKISVATHYFEHPLSGDLSLTQYRAIAQYELYLRYYVAQLKRITFPFAFHTIGSCFSLRAKTYCRQGGMNKHQAGEDFYFLQKLFQSEEIGVINTTTVFPSSRISHRVPFGTGVALSKMIDENASYYGFAFESFDVLLSVFQSIPMLYERENIAEVYANYPVYFREFIPCEVFVKKITEIKKNTCSLFYFQKRFFVWFNGFQVFKFLNFSQQYFPKQPVEVLASKLIRTTNTSVFELLKMYREKEKC